MRTYRHRIFLVLSLIATVAAGMFLLPKDSGGPLFAAISLPGVKLSGWAWSSTIGWISFNCSNIITGFPNGHCQAQGGVDYGVSVVRPPGGFTGGWEKLGGYAWANPADNIASTNNIGWITFNESNLVGCPQGTCNAQVNFTTGEVRGWARFCGVFASNCSGALRSSTALGGWDGWIELSGVNHPSPNTNGDQGITFDNSDCSFKGFAWGGDNSDSSEFAGWIKFQKTPGDTGQAYKVQIVNLPPSTPSSLVVTPSYCNHPWIFTFSWSYSDPEDDPLTYYQLQISNNGTFVGPDIVFDTNKTAISGNSNSTISQALSLCSPSPTMGCGASSIFTSGFNHDYFWRVKVWDDQPALFCSQIAESPWSGSNVFHLPIHDYPSTSFTFSPLKPSTGETIIFTNRTVFDTGSINQLYKWNFGDGTSSLTNPTHVFTTKGTKAVSLDATDDVASCGANTTIMIYPPLPNYIEKAPQ